MGAWAVAVRSGATCVDRSWLLIDVGEMAGDGVSCDSGVGGWGECVIGGGAATAKVVMLCLWLSEGARTVVSGRAGRFKKRCIAAARRGLCGLTVCGAVVDFPALPDVDPERAVVCRPPLPGRFPRYAASMRVWCRRTSPRDLNRRLGNVGLRGPIRAFTSLGHAAPRNAARAQG